MYVNWSTDFKGFFLSLKFFDLDSLISSSDFQFIHSLLQIVQDSSKYACYDWY